MAGEDRAGIFQPHRALVNADKKVPYGLVIRVISEIQNAGVVKLGFLTEPIKD